MYLYIALFFILFNIHCEPTEAVNQFWRIRKIRQQCTMLTWSKEDSAINIQTANRATKFSKSFFLKPSGSENFFKWKFFALRSILSNFRPNRSYPRDFSAVWNFPCCLNIYPCPETAQSKETSHQRHHLASRWNGPQLPLLDFGPVQGTLFKQFFAKKNFWYHFFWNRWRVNFFRDVDLIAAMKTVFFSSKSELSSRVFGRLKFFALFE